MFRYESPNPSNSLSISIGSELKSCFYENQVQYSCLGLRKILEDYF